MKIFLSVGSTFTSQQEAFVSALEARLRAEGLSPQTIGRTVFDAASPFVAINRVMDECRGVVVVAMERLHVVHGTERRGSDAATALVDLKIATPWNHIEAALGYARQLPILVVLEKGLRQDGLLEHGYDWYVFTTPVDVASFSSTEFNGILASWKRKLAAPEATTVVSAGDMTVVDLVGSLRPAQLWSLIGAFAAAIAGAVAFGAKLFP